MSLSFPVSSGKLENLRHRMTLLGLQEKDMTETFFRVSGPGGQKTNKTSTGVTLRHSPTGIRVRCQRERSQSLNRFLARRLLVEELEAREKGKTRHQVKAEIRHARKSASPKPPPAARTVQYLVYDRFLLRHLPPPPPT